MYKSVDFARRLPSTVEIRLWRAKPAPVCEDPVYSSDDEGSIAQESFQAINAETLQEYNLIIRARPRSIRDP